MTFIPKLAIALASTLLMGSVFAANTAPTVCPQPWDIHHFQVSKVQKNIGTPVIYTMTGTAHAKGHVWQVVMPTLPGSKEVKTQAAQEDAFRLSRFYMQRSYDAPVKSGLVNTTYTCKLNGTHGVATLINGM